MTLEATITKLMWLLAQPSRSYEEIKRRFYKMINHDMLFAGFRRMHREGMGKREEIQDRLREMQMLPTRSLTTAC